MATRWSRATSTLTRANRLPLEVTLQAYGGNPSRVRTAHIIIEGDPRAAVLSNGTKPDYFVGHVDEFNNDWIWHQNLLCRPAPTT